MIETVADANQHFNTRAKAKGVYEIAPSESTMLVKSLVNIAAMLKEIKEGKQVTLISLKRQTDHSQQNSIKYCGICSCNSHHTDECPQLHPLPSQPLLNPKGGLNAINDKLEREEEAANTNNKEAVQQLCEMLIEVPDSEEEDIGKILDSCKEFDSDYKEEECEE
ncbi:hypothetical protein PIB30_001612 [Stylosanthes scabra]|uniref:Uncharacterized protein n=1 Tax=Stylosanthes scabra TaxID=79078 RepID=A0ABU6S285_9FABA|nr:hypothetical protein [Stylosanthes scabra]